MFAHNTFMHSSIAIAFAFTFTIQYQNVAVYKMIPALC